MSVGFKLDQTLFSLPSNKEKKEVWPCKTTYVTLRLVVYYYWGSFHTEEEAPHVSQVYGQLV